MTKTSADYTLAVMCAAPDDAMSMERRVMTLMQTGKVTREAAERTVMREWRKVIRE